MSDDKRKSSTTIGCGWYKVSENSRDYLPILINKELLPLTITENHSLVLFPVPQEERKSEESPHYRVVMSLKEKKE